MHFDCDPKKAATNIRKHGVSFEEAQTVFYDMSARLIADPDHSVSEDRFVLLGISSRLRLLVVNHCYAGDSSVIRIFSARKANKKEVTTYEEHLP